MKTITLTTYNRPEYLKETLRSLRSNNTKGYILYVSQEPGNKECADLVKAIDFMPVESWVNPFRKGINLNAFTVLSRAFAGGSRFNVHIEDDIVLSPDALDLANWYHDLKDKTNHAGCFFCGPWSNPAWPTYVHRVEPTAVAPGAGFCITDWQWQSFVRPTWFSDYTIEWDKALEREAIAKNMVVLRPRLVRSTSIGAHGMSHAGTNDEFFITNPVSTYQDTKFFWRD
jgi:hypothetical protein